MRHYTKEETIQAFFQKVSILGARHFGASDGCWAWTASRFSGGMRYGSFYLNGKNTHAHRAAWALLRGPIPKGMCVCHRCDNPLCVNPDHLFLGTVVDNNIDRDRKGRHRTYHGSSCPWSKVSVDQERQIRDLFESGRLTQSQLSNKFRVSRSVIARCTRGCDRSKAKNGRAKHYFTHQGNTMTAQQWAKQLGLSWKAVSSRLSRGATPADALGWKEGE